MTPGTPIGFLIYLANPRAARAHARKLKRKENRRRALRLARAGAIQANGGQAHPGHPWRRAGYFRERT